MIGNFLAVLNFNRLFLELNQFSPITSVSFGRWLGIYTCPKILSCPLCPHIYVSRGHMVELKISQLANLVEMWGMPWAKCQALDQDDPRVERSIVWTLKTNSDDQEIGLDWDLKEATWSTQQLTWIHNNHQEWVEWWWHCPKDLIGGIQSQE